MTDKYAVIGNPISHSKSPLIHKIFAEQTGQDISYEAIFAELGDFQETVERLRKEGYKGCNVTVPFKLEAVQSCNQLEARARDAGVVNTLRFEGSEIIGDNTDGVGLVRDIEHNLGFNLKDKQVVLMGTGGAAYGAAAALLQANAILTLGYRTEGKARLLVSKFGDVVTIVDYANIIAEKFDVIINATSSGLSNEMPPLPSGNFAPGALAYDMMYGRETPFMKFAREQGAAIVSDGLGMLVEQAAEAFFIWRGVRPDTAPVLAKLRTP